MSMHLGCPQGLRSDINITPYIDILLVLLIIFMVVTPIRNQELKIRVPKPPPKVQVRQDTIVLSIGEQAQIAINHVPVDLADLRSRLTEIFSARQDKDLFISASSLLPYGDIVRLIDISKSAGVGDIGLVTEELH
jgi:biopolymer transport protein TolR